MTDWVLARPMARHGVGVEALVEATQNVEPGALAEIPYVPYRSQVSLVTAHHFSKPQFS